jgi:hypothetical protein
MCAIQTSKSIIGEEALVPAAVRLITGCSGVAARRHLEWRVGSTEPT